MQQQNLFHNPGQVLLSSVFKISQMTYMTDSNLVYIWVNDLKIIEGTQLSVELQIWKQV